MAIADLKIFIEDRLRAIDPSIDLEAGSPAQTQFVGPVLARLGSDPFETDIQSFLLDRFSQEFPDVFAGDPSAIYDTLIKPCILFLEPFKREIQTLRQNQTMVDPTLLSDEDADALASNFFEERNSGGFAVGTGRVFYTNPTNIDIQITNRFYTATGFGFFPTNPMFVTAEEMVFNRSGSLFYVDVPLKAEAEGSEYNIGIGDLVGVDGLLNPVRVTNLREFEDGSTKVDTSSFIASTRQALTERSLVTRRGATARLNQVFQTDLRAVQVIGAGDPEMQRDLLVGETAGNAWVQGSVSLYEKVAFVQALIVQDSQTEVPAVGDYLFVYLDKYSNSAAWSGLSQDLRFVKFVVEEVLFGPEDASSPYQCSYLVRFSGSAPEGITIPNSITLNGGFIRGSNLTISSLPSVGALSSSLSVSDGSVHVYGHTDVYVRPILQSDTKAVLSAVYDAAPYAEGSSLVTTSGSNILTDSTYNFTSNGIEAGDIVMIESGSDVGIYTIGFVNGTSINVTQSLTSSSTVRYRLIKKINIDPFEPKIIKFPFGSVSANDLSSTIGSPLASLSSNDMLDYGVKVGDTLRIKDGASAGDYTITAFDSTLGGRGLVLDSDLPATSGPNSYEVFTSLEKIERPLVRLKELLILDSSEQSTGITVPPANAVAVVPTCDFSSARVRASSQGKTGYVLPDITDYVSAGSVAGPNPGDVMSGDTVSTSDQRFSKGYDSPDGEYKPVYTDAGATRDYSEFDYRDDAKGSCSYFVATSEYTDESENFPPIDPKEGECLTIKNGPNKGSYLIKNVVKFKHKLYSPNRTVWTYFIKIHGQFPVDVFNSLITFLNETGGAAAVSELPITGAVQWDSFFKDLYDSFGTKLHAALGILGVTSPGAEALQSMVESQTQVDYEWGDPARGILRTYFTEPTVFEQNTAESINPTTYVYTNDSSEEIKFRATPTSYETTELVPARLTSDADPKDYPRDLDAGTVGEFTLTDSSNPTLFKAGIQEGDVLSVHEEVFFADSSKVNRGAVSLQNASSVITQTASAAAVSPFTVGMTGNLVFIEEGDDAAGYRVSRFLSSTQLQLDSAMSETTPTAVASGSGAWGLDGTDNKVYDAAATLDFAGYVGKYITIYGGLDHAYQGSYAIASGVVGHCVITKTNGDFPVYPATGTAQWVITDAPSTAPTSTGTGTELHGVRPFRMYQAVAKDIPISSVESLDLTLSKATWDSSSYSVTDGESQPYRIYRKNIRRITSTQMSESTDGPFYYFDTECVSLSPSSSSNIPKGVYLTTEEGTYTSYGYTHNVDDPTLSYSTKETGSLDLPTRILPVGVEDSPENYFTVLGAPIQVSYERAEVVQLVQDFLDSTEDRVTAANMLARHFLPTYVSYEATYSGGSEESVIAKDIISYIDTIPVEQPVDVSKIEELIIRRGGNPETPTKVMVVLHDWDRKVWLEINSNELGGTLTEVPYNGSARVSYFIPGPNKSGIDDSGFGERISLLRE